MSNWQDILKYDPSKPLLNSGNEQIVYFTKRDLLDSEEKSIETLWDLKIPLQILRKQQPDGSWKYPGKNKPWHTTDYDQLEAYRQIGFLIQMFGLNKSHSAIKKLQSISFLSNLKKVILEVFMRINIHQTIQRLLLSY